MCKTPGTPGWGRPWERGEAPGSGLYGTGGISLGSGAFPGSGLCGINVGILGVGAVRDRDCAEFGTGGM